MVGLDTSHVSAFAKLLHDTSAPHHVPGARVVAAFPGGSPDFDVSINRVEKFTEELRDQHGVKIVDSIAQLRGECDAVLLESVDGRVHLEQFRQIADWGLPVFIDKPFTASYADARAIADLAAQHGTPVMSASAIRYAVPFTEALAQCEGGAVTGGDFYGPMAFQDKLPGYFWYGIHFVEMLYATLGTGCVEVIAKRDGAQDIAIGTWADGRFGTVRGNRSGANTFGGTIHRETKSTSFDVSTSPKPYYASLLERILPFFQSGEIAIPVEESVEVIRFLEAANESAQTGKPVSLV